MRLRRGRDVMHIKPRKKPNIRLHDYFPMSFKGWLVFVLAMLTACATSTLLRNAPSTDVYVPLIFVLAVLITAIMTDGYFYGMLASFTSVIAVNWAFTYPYMKINFSIYGYPLTFLTMLAVGCAVSTLTSRLKEQEKIKSESEREKRAPISSAPFRTTCARRSPPSAAISASCWTIRARFPTRSGASFSPT